MKTIHNINKWSFIITLLLYLTIYFGLLAQMALGFIQIILAISLSFRWNKLSIGTKRHIISYWIIVSIYGLLFLTDLGKIHNTAIIIAFIVIIPMSIAGYFVYITHKIKESAEITSTENILTTNI